MAKTLSRAELAIDSEDDVVVVRRRVKAMAQESGFDAFATAAVTTAASELARNVFTHAGKGMAHLEAVREEGRAGLRLEFRDQGPGIADLERALAGGYSTRRSLGLGLSGSRRLVDEFQIESAAGRGTVVVVIKWARFS
jgi:serine/threonine-protein kinase RsbT